MGEFQAFWMTLIAKQGMGVKRGGEPKQRRVALVDLGIEKARSRRWYNITRIPSDCLCLVCQRPPPQPIDRPASDGGGDAVTGAGERRARENLNRCVEL